MNVSMYVCMYFACRSRRAAKGQKAGRRPADWGLLMTAGGLQFSFINQPVSQLIEAKDPKVGYACQRCDRHVF